MKSNFFPVHLPGMTFGKPSIVFQVRIWLIVAILTLFTSRSLPSAKAEQKPADSDQTEVVSAINTLLHGLITGDKNEFAFVTASDFYMFDGGERFTGNAIMAFIKSELAAGKRYKWTVTKPDVHIDGRNAWIAYVNKGVLIDSSGVSSQEWLESAFLRKEVGKWKIVFMHSTRVPAQ